MRRLADPTWPARLRELGWILLILAGLSGRLVYLHAHLPIEARPVGVGYIAGWPTGR